MQKEIKIKLKDFYWQEGYVIFNIYDDDLIDKININVKKIIKDKKYKTNTKIYSYNKSPRIVESYRLSNNCKKLAKYSKIKNMIEYLYEDKAVPFSTINFLRSTQQPLHSDYAHFGTLPERKLVGAWVALENIKLDSGPLQIVPRSHKLKTYNFIKENNNMSPTTLDQIKKNYKKYENWVKKTIKFKKLKTYTPIMKKGDCLLWESNLLHGSPLCKNPNLSRLSQVTHWTFKSVKKHYNPNFSDPTKKKFVERKVVLF